MDTKACINCFSAASSCSRKELLGKPLSKGYSNTPFCLQPSLGNGSYSVRQAQLPFLRSNIVILSQNRSSSGSDRIKGDWIELGVNVLSECSAFHVKEDEYCKTFEERGDEAFSGADVGNYGGSGSGGSGWHWRSDWESGGDEGRNWFCPWEPFFFFALLARRMRQICVKMCLPFIISQLLLQRGLLANADATIPPLKPSAVSHGNEKEAVSEEKVEVFGLCDSQPKADAVFEVRRGIWTRVLLDAEKDEFVVDPVRESNKDAFAMAEHSCSHQGKPLQVRGLGYAIKRCLDFAKNVLLPDGFPESVTGDYLEYTLWRMGQNIASQVNGVLTTQALLYAVGLGKGAIPTAAAMNWVLKDGIGYLSKILLANYGRQFDVHPKGWRLLADLLENGSYALELLTPIYPHLFVYLGAAAGAGKSAAGLIQAATRSCFYAGFAAQRNFAEVIAKGEAQGMVSKFLGIALGIAISASVGASGPTLVVTFLTVTGIHMFCNLKSYQAVELRTLNPYRACLVFGEYIRRGLIASVDEVNAAEPIFIGTQFSLFKGKQDKGSNANILSIESKEDAARITNKLKLGVSFPDVIRSQSEADRVFKIYQDEKYVLVERQNSYQALLKEGSTSHDLLKLMLQVCYLHQLRFGPTEKDYDFYFGSPTEMSYKLATDKFDLVQRQLSVAGWSTSDGLVARPLPHRLLNVPV